MHPASAGNFPPGHPRSRRAVGTTLALVLLLAFTTTGTGWARAPMARVVFAGPSASRTIALTFDDGWDAERCLSIYRTLVRLGVPATFFPSAVWAREAPHVWRTIAARFPIGNHTIHHLSLPDLPRDRLRWEISNDRQQLEAMTGRPMSHLLRPPYGASSPRVRRIAAQLGYDTVVLWDTSDGDTSPVVTAFGATRSALRGGPGSIVLMHCGPAVTPAILGIVIARYACAGFRFATVEDLLDGGHGSAARVSCPPPPLPPREHRGLDARRDRGAVPVKDGVALLRERDWLVTWLGTDGLLPPGSTAWVHFGATVASGQAGCSRFALSFTGDASDALAFGPVVRSREDCAGPDVTGTLLTELGDVTTYRLDGDVLELRDATSAVRLWLVGAGPLDLVGRWLVHRMVTDAGDLATARHPLHVTFAPAGVIEGSGPCHTFAGGYSTHGHAISAGLLYANPATCRTGTDREERDLLGALSSATSWRIARGHLMLRAADGTAVLDLTADEAAITAP